MHAHIVVRIREDGTVEDVVTACLLQDFGMGNDEPSRDLWVRRVLRYALYS